jgi:hypothetical protein
LYKAQSLENITKDECSPEKTRFNLRTHAVCSKGNGMANVSEICRKVVEKTPDALAYGVIDINTGMLIGIHHVVPHFTPEYLDAIAATAVEMFCGRTVRRVEELLGSLRGSPVKDTFEEIFVSSIMVYHFMKMIREKQVVVVLVTRKNVSQGMGWASLRNTTPDLLLALP